jgi:hypothetical protein
MRKPPPDDSWSAEEEAEFRAQMTEELEKIPPEKRAELLAKILMASRRIKEQAARRAFHGGRRENETIH